jgi:hypothetical protein
MSRDGPVWLSWFDLRQGHKFLIATSSRPAVEPTVQSVRHWGFCMRGVKLTKREADHSPISNLEVYLHLSLLLHGVMLNLEKYVTFYPPCVYYLLCLYRLLWFHTFHVVLCTTEQWSRFSVCVHIHVLLAFVGSRPWICLYTVFVSMFMIDRLVKL